MSVHTGVDFNGPALVLACVDLYLYIFTYIKALLDAMRPFNVRTGL